VLITPRNGTGTFYGPDRGVLITQGSNFSHKLISVHDFESERTSSITIRIKKLDSIGVGYYIVNESGCSQGDDSFDNNNMYCRIFDYSEGIYKTYCSFENSGEIIITRYDRDNRILSGTFSGRVRNKNNPNDIVDITDGRFDFDLNTVHTTIFP
jgi:hypothetical protein